MTVSPNRRPRSRANRGISQPSGKATLLRRLLMESLEKRELMASDFTNPFYPMDVNRDSRISALDALVVINRLNKDGAIPLSGMEANPLGSDMIDVDGDSHLSPLDALSVINYINSGRAEGELSPVAGLRYRFFRANADGTPGAELPDVITATSQPDVEVNVGERLIVRTEITDLRSLANNTGTPVGVFAGYHDLNYANDPTDPSNGGDLTAERLKFQWGEFNRLTFDPTVNGGSVTLRYDSASGEQRRATITPALNGSGTAINAANTIPRIKTALEGIFGVGNVGVFAADVVNPSNADFRISFTGNSSRRDISPEGFIESENLTTRTPVTTKVTLATQTSPNPATDKVVTRAGLNHSINNGLDLDGNQKPRFTSGPEGTLLGAGTARTTLRSVGGFVNLTNNQTEDVATSYMGVVDSLFEASIAGFVKLDGTISPLGGVEGNAVSTGIALLGAQNRYLVASEVVLPTASIRIVDQLSARPARFSVDEDSGQSAPQDLSSNWTDRTAATSRGIVSVTQPTGGTVTFTPGGSEVVFTPNADFNGDAVFTYVLRNNLQPNPIEATGVVTFTVVAKNDAPRATTTNFSVIEDQGPLVITPGSVFSAGPADESAQVVSFLTGAIVVGPTATQGTASINGAGAFEFKPADDFFGPVVIQLRGTDNGLNPDNQSSIATITINVTPVNDPPRVVSSQFGIQEDGTLNLTPNQIFEPGPANESSQTITLSLAQPVPAGVSINAAGAVVVSPVANSFAPITFSVIGTDNGTNPDNLFASTVATVTVTPVNDAPLAVDDVLAVIGLKAAQPLNVLLNDNAGPGEDQIDTIQVTDFTLPRDTVNNNVVGTLELGPNGNSLLYTPPGDVFNRSVTFSYTITDNGGLTDTATVTVFIAPPARPYAVDDNFEVAEDSPAKTHDVLSNDFGNVGFGLTLVSIDASAVTPAKGVLVQQGNLVSFDPADDFSGDVTFTYVISSGTPEPESRLVATATIRVTEVNDPPVAVNQSGSTDEDKTLTILGATITQNLSRGPGEGAQNLTLSLPINPSFNAVIDPAFGVAKLENGNLVYEPAKDYFGTVSIPYTVTDDGRTNGVLSPLSSSAIINVTVVPVNDEPVAVNDTAPSTAEDTAITISISSLTNNDRPGPANETESFDFVALSGVVDTAGGSVAQVNNNLVYTPKLNFNGTDTFTYQIRDQGSPSLLSTPATVTFTVTEVNDVPVSSPVTRSMFASVPTTFDISSDLDAMAKSLANPADERGQSFRIVPGSSVVNTTANGNVTATLNANGTITFFAPLNTSGRQTFSYEIEDNGTTNGTLDRKRTTGVFHVDVLPFIPSDFRGVVYVDDNLDGLVGSNELRIAGADVTLTIPADPSVPGSRPTQRKAVTDTAGTYFFDLLPPGAYTVTYAIPMLTDDRPDNQTGGANTLSRTIVAPGDAHFEANFAVQGIKSSQISILDNLSWNYMIKHGRTDLVPKGLYAAIGADGKSEWTMARDSYKSDTFHEVVLSDDGSRAYLTAVRGNEVYTATLNPGQFFTVPDSAGNKLVRVLAPKEELTWQRVNTAAPPVTIASRRYLDAVDEYFASEG